MTPKPKTTLVKSDIKNAIVDMASSLAGVFKKYTRSTREKAWKDLTDHRGQVEIKKILQDPSRPINTFQKLSFREWLDDDQREG
jgi:hypothetical protein